MEKIPLKSERAYLFNPSSNTDLLFKFNDTFNIEQLALAANKLVTYYKFLNRTIYLDNGVAIYHSIEHLPPFIDIVEKANLKTYKKILSEEERIPFDLRNGSLLRIIAIQDEDTCDLLFIMHHLLGDTKSAFQVAKSFVKFLDDETYIEKDIIDDNLIVCKDVKLPVFSQFFLTDIKRSWLKKYKISTMDEYRALFGRYYYKHKTKVLKKVFTKEETSIIMDYTKHLDVTLSSIICAAFTFSEHQHEIKDTKEFHTCTINKDLRDYEFDKAFKIGNYCSSVTFVYQYNAHYSYIKNILKVEALKKEKLDSNAQYISIKFKEELPATLIDAMFVDGDKDDCLPSVTKIKKRLYNVEKCYGMEVCNLEDHKINLVNIKLIDAFVLPALAPSYEKNIGIINVNGIMSISMQYNGLSVNNSDMGLVFSDGINHIMEWVKSGI